MTSCLKSWNFSRSSWEWRRGTQQSSELQMKKCDLVLKSSECVCVWKGLIWNTWMNETLFRQGRAACTSVWTASSLPGHPAPLPWPLEFLGKVWRGSNWKRRHAFECVLWPRRSVQFPQVWISLSLPWTRFVTATHSTSSSTPSRWSHGVNLLEK